MSAPNRRFWLVSISVAAHSALFLGVFASGVWRLDKLDADKRSIDLAVMMPPPAPSGSPISLPTTNFPHKPIAHGPVQPHEKVVETTKPIAEVAPTPGNGEGSGSGSGSNKDGNPDDPGTCTTPPCGPATAPPVVTQPQLPDIAKVVQTTVLPPTVLKSLRYAGNTELVPSDNTKTRMMRDDHMRTVGTVKVCLSETGSITSITVASSTHYADYDRLLVDGIRGWLYHPYQINGRGVPACGMVTFIYTIK